MDKVKNSNIPQTCAKVARIMWDRFHSASGVEEDDIFDYFSGYALVLQDQLARFLQEAIEEKNFFSHEEYLNVVKQNCRSLLAFQKV